LGLKFPDRFAAIVPICGGGQIIRLLLPDKTKADALKTLPVWAFHGEKDSLVDVEESRRMVGACEEAGMENVQLTTYPEADHDSWTETYNNPELYRWFLRHSRPERILSATPDRKRRGRA
jgi:predicted peptidase